MKNVAFRPCLNDDDYAKASLFFLERKFDLGSSFSTMQMAGLLCVYAAEGSIHLAELPDGKAIGAFAYFHGTPEEEYQNKDIALIDLMIVDRSYRSTRLFLYCLEYMGNWVLQTHPEVKILRFKALSDNEYLCRLYGRIADVIGTRISERGEETLFAADIPRIRDFFARFRRV